jgi:hypothetical protein
MLHDPRHDKTPSLAGFALFCASKPADEKYEWQDCRRCPYGLYLQEFGHEPMLTQYWWSGAGEIMNALARGRNPLGLWDKTEWTYGKLVERILHHQMAAERV